MVLKHLAYFCPPPPHLFSILSRLQVELLRRDISLERKKQDDLMRERDVLAKKKEQVENSTQKQVDMLRINENNK